jgi:hypothetical protein
MERYGSITPGWCQDLAIAALHYSRAGNHMFTPSYASRSLLTSWRGLRGAVRIRGPLERLRYSEMLRMLGAVITIVRAPDEEVASVVYFY